MPLSTSNLITFACIIFITNTQTSCGFCYGEPSNFTCNGRYCQSFEWPNNRSIDPSYIDCKFYTSSFRTVECYYLAYQSPPKDWYVACNYTIPGCSTCKKGQSCNECYPGYYRYLPSAEMPFYSCRKCQDAILGCEICQNQNNCTQCEIPNLLINGVCYERDGKTLPKGKPVVTSDVQLDEIATILFVLTVLTGVGFLAVFAAIFCRKNVKNYDPLLQHQN